VIANEMTNIIEQGVYEGVFSVAHIPETAVILMTVINSLSETMNELMFNPDKYNDPTTLALQKNTAVQTAVERILDAPTGSMDLIDDETLIAWFTD
jgi:hypothetical protein